MRNRLSRIWRSPWFRPIGLAVLFAVPAGIASAFILRGTYGHWLIQIFIAGGGGQLMLAISAVSGIWWFWQRSPTALRIIRYTTAGLVFLVLQALLSLPVGGAIAAHDQQQIKAYCESLIPFLESHHAAYGEYPKTLGQLEQAPSPPAAARDEILYHRRDDKYEFTVLDNRELFGWWTLRHDQQEWEHFVD